MTARAPGWVRTWWPLLLPAAAVAALFWHHIGQWPIWYDEGFTSMMLRYDAAEIVDRTVDDVHPPLYYLVVKLWAVVFGTSLTALRGFSATCMLASVLLVAHLSRRLGLVRNRWEAAIVVSAAGTGSATLLYAQEARMYGFGSLLVLLSTLALLRLKELPGVGRAAAYGTLVAACAYTHYFSLGFVLVHLWWWLRQPMPARDRRWFAVAAGVASALFVPWLPRLLRQLHRVGGGFWIDEVTWQTPIAVVYEVLSAETTLTDTAWMGMVVAAAVIAVLLGVLPATPLERRNIALLLAPLPLTVVLLYLASLDAFGFSSVLLPRYLALLAPPMYAGMAVAILIRMRSSPAIGALLAAVLAVVLARGAWLAISGVSLEFRADVASVAAHLDRHAGAGDVIVVDRYYHFFGIAHHLRGDGRLRVVDEGDQFGGAAVLRDGPHLMSPDGVARLDAPLWLVRDDPAIDAYRERMARILADRPVLSTTSYRGLEIVELGKP